MRQYQKETKEIENVQKIICNKCGKEIPVSNGREAEGVFHVDYTWGIFQERMASGIPLICARHVTMRC